MGILHNSVLIFSTFLYYPRIQHTSTKCRVIYIYFVQLRIAKVKQTTTNGIDSTYLQVRAEDRKMSRKAVFFDADGTVCDIEKGVPDSAVRAITCSL